MMSSHHRAKSRRSPLPRRSRNASASSPAGRHDSTAAAATGNEQIRSQWHGEAMTDMRAPFLGAPLPPITPSPDVPVLPAHSHAKGNSNANGNGHAPLGSDSGHPAYPPPVHVGPPSGTPASSASGTPQQHSTRLQFSPLPIAAASLLSQSPFTPLRSHSSASPAPSAAAAGSLSPFAGMSFKTSPVTPAQQNQVAAERLEFLRRSTPLAILPTNAVGSASNSRTGSRSGTRPPTPLHSPRRGGALSISSLSLGGTGGGLHSGSNMGSPNSAHSFGQGNRSANASTSPVPPRQHHQHSASASFAYPLVSAPPASAPIPEHRPLPPPDLPPSTQPVQPAPPAPTPVTPPLPAAQAVAVEAPSTFPASEFVPASEPAAAAPAVPPSSSPLTTALAMLSSNSSSSSPPILSPPPVLTDQLVLTSNGGTATEAPVPLHLSETAALTLGPTSEPVPSSAVTAAPVAASPPSDAVTLTPPAAPVAPIAAHDRIADLLDEPEAPLLSLSPMDRELQLLAAGEKDVPRVSPSAPMPADITVDAIRALNDASDCSALPFQAADSADSPPLMLEVPHSYLVVGGVVAVGVAVWWWRAELEERVRRLLR